MCIWLLTKNPPPSTNWTCNVSSYSRETVFGNIDVYAFNVQPSFIKTLTNWTFEAICLSTKLPSYATSAHLKQRTWMSDSWESKWQMKKQWWEEWNTPIRSLQCRVELQTWIKTRATRWLYDFRSTWPVRCFDAASGFKSQGPKGEVKQQKQMSSNQNTAHLFRVGIAKLHLDLIRAWIEDQVGPFLISRQTPAIWAPLESTQPHTRPSSSGCTSGSIATALWKGHCSDCSKPDP